MSKRGAIDPVARIKTKVGALLTPEQIASSGTEHAHQAAVMQWVAVDGRQYAGLDLLFAIANGGDRRMSVAASLKAEGVKPGVPDLCLPVPAGAYPGLWIEMKKPGEWGKALGGRSSGQLEWHKRLRAQGYAVCTCYSWRSAVAVLIMYHTGTEIMKDAGVDGLMVNDELCGRWAVLPPPVDAP